MTMPDAIARQIVHGTPQGFELGCKSQGGCANHGSATLMTCADAARAARSDWSLKDIPQDEPWPKRIRKLARPARPALRIVEAAHSPQPSRRSPQRETPSSSTPSERKPRPAAESSTAGTPTRHGARAGRQAAAMKKARRPRGPQPIKHGTVWGYARGCDTIEGCPNHALGLPSCVEERRRYNREYAARRRRGDGPEIAHGTTTGYSLGCHDRSLCPGNAEGLTCSDAQREADLRRRRSKGVAPRAELTDSAPARERIHALQDAGLTIMQIVERTQVSKTAIRCLIYGRDDYVNGEKGPRHGEIPARITAEKAQRILSVEIPRGGLIEAEA